MPGKNLLGDIDRCGNNTDGLGFSNQLAGFGASRQRIRGRSTQHRTCQVGSPLDGKGAERPAQSNTAFCKCSGSFMASVMLLLIGVIFILVGIRTVKRRETKIIIRLWSWGDDNPRSPGGGFSESVQTGFVAVFIGVAEVMLGVAAFVQVFTKH